MCRLPISIPPAPPPAETQPFIATFSPVCPEPVLVLNSSIFIRIFIRPITNEQSVVRTVVGGVHRRRAAVVVIREPHHCFGYIRLREREPPAKRAPLLFWSACFLLFVCRQTVLANPLLLRLLLFLKSGTAKSERANASRLTVVATPPLASGA